MYNIKVYSLIYYFFRLWTQTLRIPQCPCLRCLPPWPRAALCSGSARKAIVSLRVMYFARLRPIRQLYRSRRRYKRWHHYAHACTVVSVLAHMFFLLFFFFLFFPHCHKCMQTHALAHFIPLAFFPATNNNVCVCFLIIVLTHVVFRFPLGGRFLGEDIGARQNCRHSNWPRKHSTHTLLFTYIYAHTLFSDIQIGRVITAHTHHYSTHDYAHLLIYAHTLTTPRHCGKTHAYYYILFIFFFPA